MPVKQPSAKLYYLVIMLFVFFLIAGIIFGFDGVFTTNYIKESFGTLSFLDNLSGIMLFLFIFLNNSIKSFFVILFGIFFGLVPFYFAAVNAFLIGLVITYITVQRGFLVAMVGLLPHGILEIPAILLAVVYGFWIGTGFIRSFKTKESVRPMIRYSMKKYVQIILPMLLVAALIETFVTPILIALVIK